MFFVEGQVRVFLYGQPFNMRLSFDGLYALAKDVMHQNPLSGNLFAYINRRAIQIRVLYFDRSGLCVGAKRLEKRRFVSNWADVTSREMDWTGVKLLLEGIERNRCASATKNPLPGPEMSLSTLRKIYNIGMHSDPQFASEIASPAVGLTAPEMSVLINAQE